MPDSNVLHLTRGRKRLFAQTTLWVFKWSYLHFMLKLVLETDRPFLGKHNAGWASSVPGQGVQPSLCSYCQHFPSLRQAQSWALSQQKLDNMPAFALCVEQHVIFRATFPSQVWLGSSRIVSSNWFFILLTKPACIEKRRQLLTRPSFRAGVQQKWSWSHQPTHFCLDYVLLERKKNRNQTS